jgi:hypothetical protein
MGEINNLGKLLPKRMNLLLAINLLLLKSTKAENKSSEFQLMALEK